MADNLNIINPAIVNRLGEELLNTVSKEIQTSTALYERKTLKFRDIIDNAFPTMLVVDYNDIRKELSLYNDIDSSLKTYISETYKPTEKDYSANKLSKAEIDILLDAIKTGFRKFGAQTISYITLQEKLKNIVDNGTEATVLQRTKALFSVPYKLTGVTGAIGATEIYIFPNFARVGDLLRVNLEIGLSIAEATQGNTGVNSIGQILAYGHTAVGYLDSDGKAVLNFNTPKMIAIMFDVISSANDNAKATAIQNSVQAVTSFATDTRQIETYISLDKKFSENFIKLFVEVGGNIVKFENSLINSRRGSVLEKTEKRGVNKYVLDRLAFAFSKTQSVMGSRLARYMLTKKSSPNVIEYSIDLIKSTLEGKKLPKSKSGSTIKATKKDTISKQVVTGGIKAKVKIPKTPIPKTNVPIRAQTTNLISLQNLLDAHLQDVVSANMGDGGRTDVLNYRTGRLAASAKVERLSESREGMITAFYSYMKNPYATFSDGGRQSRPKSRDPKLLISKSIKEIATEKVANRMRTVLV